MGRIRSRLTYANVMVTILAFIVIGGGSAAAVNYVVSSNSQIGPDTVSGHSPPAGRHANLIPGSVNGADVADDSVRGTDVLESSLGTVPNAEHAAGANTLAGSPANAFQRRVTGSCKQARGSAISRVKSDGTVACAFRTVYPIDLTPANGNFPLHVRFGTSPLEIDASCRPTELFFFNLGSGAATLNWMFSEGTTSATTVNASGTSIAQNGNVTFSYGNSGRLEGQWIFSNGGITTVNLHAFQGPDSCEVRGTALWAPD